MKVPIINLVPRLFVLTLIPRWSIIFVPARYERQNEEPGYEVDL
jgi:hypothetical protein